MRAVSLSVTEHGDESVVMRAVSLSVTEAMLHDVTSALTNIGDARGAAHCLRHTPAFSTSWMASFVATRRHHHSTINSFTQVHWQYLLVNL